MFSWSRLLLDMLARTKLQLLFEPTCQRLLSRFPILVLVLVTLGLGCGFVLLLSIVFFGRLGLAHKLAVLFHTG